MPTKKHRFIDEEDRWILDLIKEAKKEQKRNPKMTQQLFREAREANPKPQSLMYFTPVGEQIVARGFAQLRDGEYETWETLRRELSPDDL